MKPTSGYRVRLARTAQKPSQATRRRPPNMSCSGLGPASPASARRGPSKRSSVLRQRRCVIGRHRLRLWLRRVRIVTVLAGLLVWRLGFIFAAHWYSPCCCGNFAGQRPTSGLPLREPAPRRRGLEIKDPRVRARAQPRELPSPHYRPERARGSSNYQSAASSGKSCPASRRDQVCRQLRHAFGERCRRALQYAREHGAHRWAKVRRFAGQDVIEQRAEPVDVRPFVHLVAARLLGGHVCWRSDRCAWLVVSSGFELGSRAVGRGLLGRSGRAQRGQAAVGRPGLEVERHHGERVPRRPIRSSVDSEARHRGAVRARPDLGHPLECLR